MIYYVFRKSDGLYMGNGITHFDDDTYGSTVEPVCGLEDGQTAAWDGSKWEIV